MALQVSKLEAKTRVGAGKGPARRTRVDGMIPACVYGKGLDKPLNIALNAKALKAAVHTEKKLNTIIGLSVDGKEHIVLLKDYQMDPVSKDLLHADFIAVRENEQVKVKIPLVLTGKSIGVAEGGILSQMRRELEVWSLPGSIPLSIEADVSHLKIATALHINEIKLPAGITVKTHVNFTIAVVTAPEIEKVVEVAAPVAGAVAGAPGAPAAAGADGKAAPAAGADGKAAPAAAGAAKAPAAKK
ncbi:MAG: 50S ribosomal protein L25 [Archangium sp.]|nr:50S ribosomal protein L25 [Archangium sp.]